MTTYDEVCPSCDRTDGNHWVESTAGGDTWACRCGHEWTIQVDPRTFANRTAPCREN